MHSVILISRPMIPNALSGAGQSAQSLGIPSPAGELRIIWSQCVLVVSLTSAPNVHSQRICSVVSSLFSVQCGQILENDSPCRVFNSQGGEANLGSDSSWHSNF